MITDVIIPALNEQDSIARVIRDLPTQFIRNIIVCNNGSTDNTAVNAVEVGAIVVEEQEKGYGAACLKGLEYIYNLDVKPDIVLFIDGDYSDYPQEASLVLKPIIEDDYEMVIGSRVLGNSQKGSLTHVQRFGNWLSTKLIFWIFNYQFTDLGPFRAIRYKGLELIQMKDRNFGWTVEMQVKAAKYKLRTIEVPVSYRNRIGKSKVSGTIKGSIKAGVKILYTIFSLV